LPFICPKIKVTGYNSGKIWYIKLSGEMF